MVLRLGWSCVILLLMLIPLPEGDPHWFGRLDLLVHFGLFAVLGGLNRDLMRRGREGGVRKLGLLFLVSVVVLPELLQSFVPTRGFDFLDLAANGSGAAWGILVGSLLPSLAYLLTAGGLMGVTGGLILLRSFSYELLFQPIYSGGVLIALLLPLVPPLGWLWRRNGPALLGTGVLYVFFLMQVKTAAHGPGVLLGGLTLSVWLFTRQLPPHSLTVSLELSALSGFGLFVLKNGLGLGTFLAGGGHFVLGVLIFGTIVQLILIRPVNPVRFRPQFQEATRK